MKIGMVSDRLNFVQDKLDHAWNFIEKIEDISSELEFAKSHHPDEITFYLSDSRTLLLPCTMFCGCPICSTARILRDTQAHWGIGAEDLREIEQKFRESRERLKIAVEEAESLLMGKR